MTIRNARKQGLHYANKAGHHFSGIPARDLSPDEVNELPEHLLKACLESGVYVVAGPEEKEKESHE